MARLKRSGKLSWRNPLPARCERQGQANRTKSAGRCVADPKLGRAQETKIETQPYLFLWEQRQHLRVATSARLRSTTVRAVQARPGSGWGCLPPALAGSCCSVD